MKVSNYTSILAAFARSKTRYAECMRITREDGQVFAFTSHDSELLFGLDASDNVVVPPGLAPIVFKPAESFNLSALETTRGFSVDNMDLEGIISDDSISVDDLLQGKFDNAVVELYLVYWFDRTLGLVPLRKATIGQIVTDRNKYTADIRGLTQRLAQTFMPRLSLRCRYGFGDANCTVNKATYTHVATVTRVVSADVFEFSVVATLSANYFQWGELTWATGNNTGVKAEILRHYNDVIQLFLPAKALIQVGDTADVVAGCSHVPNACRIFSNYINYGGEPYIQGSEIFGRYPTAVLISDVPPDDD